jgi:hypothetical protein
MSRSGYSDDCDNLGLWRGAVRRATTGYRGQHLLKRLRDALDAMPVKRLIADEIQNASGEVCTLGALDPSVKEYSAVYLAEHFKIAHALAAEITYMNDEFRRTTWSMGIDGKYVRHDETPEQRWTRMRAWVEEQIAPDAVDPVGGDTTE